jgi:hypothetical protein
VAKASDGQTTQIKSEPFILDRGLNKTIVQAAIIIFNQQGTGKSGVLDWLMKK